MTVKHPYGTYTYPRLEVNMCDKKAVQHVAKHLGKRVRKGEKYMCRNKTPERRTSVTSAVSRDALKAMKEIEPYIKGTELQRKWLKALRECRREG